MTKQSRHPRRRRPNNLWIAMLATLAFTGAGQALAPAPAAALHIDACAQPDSGLCDAAGEGPTSGDSSSGDNKGGGGSAGRPTAPPPPSTAPWDQRGSNSLPTQTTKAAASRHDKAARYRRVCGMIGDRIADLQDRIDRDTVWFNQSVSGTDLDQPGQHLDAGEIDWVKAILDARKVMKRRLQSLDHGWEDYNCTELGSSELGL